MNKSFGFSREEFSLLCNVYNIMELVCFEQKEGSVTENRTVDEIYHQTLFQLCRKEFPQRQKVVKQVKYLLRGKEYSTCG